MELGIAALAVLAAHVTRAVTGFGSALVALPVLVVLWPPAEAVTVIALLDLASGVLLLPALRHRVIVPLLLVMVACLVPGQWLGTGLLAVLPASGVRLLLGALLLPLALDILVRPVRPGRGELQDLPEARGSILALGALAGGAGGVLSGAVGAGGPPVVLFLRRYFERDTFRAQALATFVSGAVPLLAMLWLRGLVTVEAVEHAAILVPVVWAGVLLGHRLARRLPAPAFGRVVGGVLVLAALSLLAR